MNSARGKPSRTEFSLLSIARCSDRKGEENRKKKNKKRGEVSQLRSDCGSKLASTRPSRGTAGFVMANGSLSSNQSGQGDVRKNIIEAELAECIVTLTVQLFSTQIPVCLWFLTRNKGRP